MKTHVYGQFRCANKHLLANAALVLLPSLSLRSFSHSHLFFPHLFVHLVLIRYSHTEQHVIRFFFFLLFSSPLFQNVLTFQNRPRIFRAFRIWILFFVLPLFCSSFSIVLRDECVAFPYKLCCPFPHKKGIKTEERHTHTRYTNGDFALQRHRSNDHHDDDLCFEERGVVQSERIWWWLVLAVSSSSSATAQMDKRRTLKAVTNSNSSSRRRRTPTERRRRRRRATTSKKGKE